MKARVSQLHKTEADWVKLQNDYKEQGKEFVPQAGEIIVYDPDENYKYARVKIGDGQQSLQELAFIIDAAVDVLTKKSNHFDAGRIS